MRGAIKVFLPLLALMVGVYSYKYLKTSRPVLPDPVRKEVVHPVRSQEIRLVSFQPRLRLFGEARAARKVDLRVAVAGKVVKTGEGLQEGALVKKADLLLSVDPFVYEGALVEAAARLAEARARLKEIKAQIGAEEASIRFAREQLQLAKRDLERAFRLVKKGSVTRQGVDQRTLVVSQKQQVLEGKRSNLLVLQARAEQQEAALDSLKWQLRQAERNRRDTELRAPFTGYVSEVGASEGKLLNVNDRVAVLYDASRLDVAFTLSDQQYGRLLEGGDDRQESTTGGVVGRAVKVIWRLGETQLRYDGVVERIGARVSSQSGGVSVFARLNDPSRPKPIRAGTFVEVILPDRIYHKVARLPQTALYDRDRIYVIGPENRLVERRVRLRAIDGEHVLISSAELVSGERVVTSRLSVIGGGMKVKDLGESETGSRGMPGQLSPVSRRQASRGNKIKNAGNAPAGQSAKGREGRQPVLAGPKPGKGTKSNPAAKSREEKAYPPRTGTPRKERQYRG